MKPSNRHDMKNYFLIVIALVAILWSACDESPYINSPGDNRFNTQNISVLVPDTNGTIVTIAQALELAAPLKDDEKTPEQYKITGTFTFVKMQKPQINFTLSDGTNLITCQYTKNINNTPFYDMKQVPENGSIVTVQGPLSKYKGTPQLYEGFIVRIDKKE